MEASGNQGDSEKRVGQIAVFNQRVRYLANGVAQGEIVPDFSTRLVDVW